MLRKSDTNILQICPPSHLSDIATLPRKAQKSFLTVLFIRTSDYLCYLRSSSYLQFISCCVQWCGLTIRPQLPASCWEKLVRLWSPPHRRSCQFHCVPSCSLAAQWRSSALHAGDHTTSHGARRWPHNQSQFTQVTIQRATAHAGDHTTSHSSHRWPHNEPWLMQVTTQQAMVHTGDYTTVTFHCQDKKIGTFSRLLLTLMAYNLTRVPISHKVTITTTLSESHTLSV